jgi:hypothetical protein
VRDVVYARVTQIYENRAIDALDVDELRVVGAFAEREAGKKESLEQNSTEESAEIHDAPMSIRNNCGRGSDLGKTLQDEPRAVFRNVETQLHI